VWRMADSGIRSGDSSLTMNPRAHLASQAKGVGRS
jgi:hypothetical protein